MEIRSLKPTTCRSLSDFVGSRDNNFNLIRMVAASAVLFTHSFAIVYGDADAEPLRAELGLTLGTIAVDIFFVTSGLLVTGSLCGRANWIDFIWARVLRIFPALWIMLAITVFGMGLIVTELSAREYLGSTQTWQYLAACGTLLLGVKYDLPGVFTDNVYGGAINGSLWTMPHEIRMYVILLLLWLVVRKLVAARSDELFRRVIVLLTAAFLVGAVYLRFDPASTTKVFHLGYMFFTGATFHLLRERILLRAKWAALAGGVVVVAGLLGKDMFFLTYLLTLPYIVLCAAYLPGGWIRHYNRLGDYSYGVYIYAFPLQQLVVFLIPGIALWPMISLSFAVTIVLATASWYLVERHALRLKQAYVARTRTLLRLS